MHQGCLLSWIDSRLKSSISSSQESIDDDADDALNMQPHLVLPQLSCPQCHVVYRVEEGSLLPKPLMSGLQVIHDGWRWLVIRSAIFGTFATFYGCCWLYGATLIVLVSEGGAIVFQPDPMGMMRVLVGLPLMPFFVVSLRHTGLAWTLAPLLPPLLLRPSDLQWPPSSSALQLLSIPLLTSAWSQLHHRLFARLRARLSSNNSETAAVDRWGLYRISETLLLPFIAYGISWSTALALRHLFGLKLPGTLLTRTMLTGGFLLFTTDLIDQLGQLQGLYGQMTRRVLENATEDQ